MRREEFRGSMGRSQQEGIRCEKIKISYTATPYPSSKNPRRSCAGSVRSGSRGEVR